MQKSRKIVNCRDQAEDAEDNDRSFWLRTVLKKRNGIVPCINEKIMVFDLYEQQSVRFKLSCSQSPQVIYLLVFRSCLRISKIMTISIQLWPLTEVALSLGIYYSCWT